MMKFLNYVYKFNMAARGLDVPVCPISFQADRHRNYHLLSLPVQFCQPRLMLSNMIRRWKSNLQLIFAFSHRWEFTAIKRMPTHSALLEVSFNSGTQAHASHCVCVCVQVCVKIYAHHLAAATFLKTERKQLTRVSVTHYQWNATDHVDFLSLKNSISIKEQKRINLTQLESDWSEKQV